MKNKYLYSILVCLFLLIGKVEVVCGQEWYEYAEWTKTKIKKDITIESLTDEIKTILKDISVIKKSTQRNDDQLVEIGFFHKIRNYR